VDVLVQEAFDEAGDLVVDAVGELFLRLQRKRSGD